MHLHVYDYVSCTSRIKLPSEKIRYLPVLISIDSWKRFHAQTIRPDNFIEGNTQTQSSLPTANGIRHSNVLRAAMIRDFTKGVLVALVIASAKAQRCFELGTSEISVVNSTTCRFI